MPTAILDMQSVLYIITTLLFFTGLMMTKKDVHVVPHDDGWATRKEGASRAGRVVDTQQEAIDLAREQAKRDHVEVVIHRKDGSIRDSDSYGNDPFPPRDRKH